jgi:hypothetical protein
MADQQPFTPNPKDLDLLRKYFKEISDDAGSLEDYMRLVSKNANLFSTELGKAREHFGDLGDAASRLASSIKDSINDMSKGNYYTKSMIGGFRSLESIATKFKNDMLDYSTMSKVEIQRNISKIQQNQELLNSLKDQANLTKEQKDEIRSVIKESEELLKQAIARLEKEKEINKNLGIGGQAFKALSNQLKKLGVDSEVIDDMNKKLRDLAKDGKVTFKDFAKTIKDGLTEAFRDPMVQFALGLKLVKSGFDDIKKGINAFLEYDKIFTSAARDTGLTADQVKRVVDQSKAANTEIRGTKGAVTDTLYTTEQLAKSFGEINAQLGLSVDLGAETLNEFTAMTNQMGLTADEATKIYKLGLLNNMSLEDTNKTIASSIVAVQKQTGVQLNAKQIFQEIGKLSAGITAKFQQNPAALAKAVAQAKALGTNLEQVDKVGESLLNFESSIESELKAELLTGKQLNLEKARYAALTGDQATLTQELANQVGSLADFQGMNVIAQKSLAEAFGMSRDEVAGMLQQQETFNKLGDVSGKSAQEQLEIAKKKGLSETDSLMVNLKQQATAEKTAAAFDSLKAALASVFEGFKPLLDMMVEFSKHTSLVVGALTLMAGISFAKTIGGLVLMAVQLGLITSFKAAGAAADAAGAAAMGTQVSEAGSLAAAESVVTGEKLSQMVASILANPFVAIAGMVAAAAAVAFVANAAMKKPKMAKGGIIPPTPGGTDVTVGEAGSHEAIIPLNSPKAGEMLGIDRATQSSPDMSIVTNAISALSNTVNGLINRPQPSPQFALHVDGRQLGTVVGSQMETGTAQNIHTGYKLA